MSRAIPRERPILMSAPMVRALLDGRKTQTRRAVKFTAKHGAPGHYLGAIGTGEHVFSATERWGGQMRCPYGVPCDRLWVREAWKAPERLDATPPRDIPAETRVSYVADDRLWPVARYRAGMHMPRWASRLTLEITEVRVERLQDISHEDARAEGAPQYSSALKLARDRPFNPDLKGIYREGFSELWEDINGPGSWDANPWVWAVSFRVLAPAQQKNAA